jgi:hypothetical protein
MALFICKYANEDLVARLAGVVSSSEYRMNNTYVSTLEGTSLIDVRCPHEVKETQREREREREGEKREERRRIRVRGSVSSSPSFFSNLSY